MTAIEFYFDFSCPWSYLALVRLRETALRTGAEIIWKPFELQHLVGPVDTRATRLAADPQRAAWQLADLERWAEYCGVQATQGVWCCVVAGS